MTEPTLIADYECHTGEGPLWHPDEERLYWVDIPAGRLFRYDPATGTHEQRYRTDTISAVTVQADGSVLLFEDGGTIERLADGTVSTVIESIPEERETRFNDVIADPEGRVFCGTMPTAERSGRLYRLDRDGSLERVLDEIDLPNGLGFTPDRTQLYVTESNAKCIHRFDYDAGTGAISDPEPFVDLTGERGVPDGMTVDADGAVWSARWNGGCIVRYDPAGTETRRIDLPARKVSAIAFGENAYRTAYITTALDSDDDRARAEEGPGAGALFSLDLGVGGTAPFRSRIDC